jgi:RNA polymerase sigma-70 factor, ECF subfamily
MLFSSTDRELMQRIAHQDESALAQLYQRYANLVYSLAYRTLQDAALTEEAVQDTFLDVWRQPESWDPDKGKLTSWLLTIARYKAIDRLRKEVHQPVNNAVRLDDTSNLMEGDLASDIQWQDGQLLRALMKRLSPEQAQVIELAFFRGMTHSELAEALHLPLGTVKTRLRLGLIKLRELWLEATRERD